jgi:hypothetical protein
MHGNMNVKLNSVMRLYCFPVLSKYRIFPDYLIFGS